MSRFPGRRPARQPRLSAINILGWVMVTVLVAGLMAYALLNPDSWEEWLLATGLSILGVLLIAFTARWLGGSLATERIVDEPVVMHAYDEPMADVFCVIASLAGVTGRRTSAALKPVSRERDAILVLHDALSAHADAWQHVRCWDDQRAPLEVAARRAEHRLHALDVLATPKGPTADRGYREGVDGLTVVVLVVTAGFEIPELGEAPSRASILRTLRLLASATGVEVSATVATHGPLLAKDLELLQPPLLPMSGYP